MKKIEEMTDHELLMELVAEKRQRDAQKKIKIAIWIAAAILILYLLGSTCQRLSKYITSGMPCSNRYSPRARRLTAS